VICVETRHMQAVLKAQINKTDRHDARGIAQMMRPEADIASQSGSGAPGSTVAQKLRLSGRKGLAALLVKHAASLPPGLPRSMVK
jgi:hypothetical protein